MKDRSAFRKHRREYMRDYYARNPEYKTYCVEKAKKADWKRKHPEGTREIAKRYNRSPKGHLTKKRFKILNPEKLKAQSKAAYHRDIEQTRAKNREYYYRDIQASREKQRRWKAKHREAVNAKNRMKYAADPSHDANRRSIRRCKEKAGIKDCAPKISLLRKTSKFCRWCCARLTAKNFSLDHIIALHRGGGHVPDNIAASCASCNSSKGDRPLHSWLPTVIMASA